MKVFGAVLVVLCAIACGAPQPRPQVLEDTPQCADACARLEYLGCEEGRPLDDGTSCEKFCVDTQDSGHWLNPSCVVKIEKCEELETVCRQG